MKAQLAEHINYRAQTDLFFVFDKTFIALVDECIRWCLVEELPRKTADEWMAVDFGSWIRHFGPMFYLVTDQEGAIASDLVGKCCEKFDVARNFGGSQGPATAPVAESWIEIARAGSQKLWATVQKTGLGATQSRVVCEVAMSTSGMLSYNGHAPGLAWISAARAARPRGQDDLCSRRGA